MEIAYHQLSHITTIPAKKGKVLVQLAANNDIDLALYTKATGKPLLQQQDYDNSGEGAVNWG